MSVYNFKRIQVVPTANDFIDIVLSKTQRKTPTVVHKHFQISRIRSFYLRKVKFTRDSFDQKLSQILTDFPVLDDIHPFYADLINVLYDRDHYKLALGQVNTAKNLIENIGRDYTRLLKYGDSLYRCKQLKKAALGRMATVMKRQKDTLAYLEQVRQHMSRLPSIDPNTRTLLVCGYPNVGKSSFINKLSRADVDVQPYAFTTKSLFVGHMDYKYLRWQVIDTPGILDHPLEERNTIEMLSITALAHLRACILYFMDLTEQCGYSVADQVKLFHSIKPLFANKPLMLVINKIDTTKLEDLSEQDRAAVNEILESDNNVQLCQMSCHGDIGVMETRNTACDRLLASRVESKMRGTKVNNILHRIHVAQPMERDEKPRPSVIPESVSKRRGQPAPEIKLEKDIEIENGGPGVYNVDLKKKYILANEDWKYDVIPEIMDGHNVADFIDPEIEAKLDALEREEEKLEQGGFYEDKMPELTEDDLKTRDLAKEIFKKKKMVMDASKEAKGKNRPVLTLKTKSKFRSLSEMSSQLGSLGIDTSKAVDSLEKSRQGRKRMRSPGPEDIMRESKRGSVLESNEFMTGLNKANIVRDRSTAGLKNNEQKSFAKKLKKLSQRQSNYHSKKGEADRAVLQSRPKHLFAGKRGIGSTDRR